MNIELLEIRDFVEGLPPFRGLDEESLNGLVQRLAIRYLRRGTLFPPGDEEGGLYIVRQGAIELRNADGVLRQKLSEGESYGDRCSGALQPDEPLIGHCSEDTLLYRLPCGDLEALFQQQPGLRRQFERSRSERLQEARLEFTPEGMAQSPLMGLSAAQLVSRPATTIAPDATAQQVAQQMSAQESSAIVVVDGEQAIGILTDKDLRNRLLAPGRPATTPVSELMTSMLQTLEAETPAFEALLTMARLNIHHLPVVENGRLLGVLTHGDLVRHESASAVYLIEELRRCRELEPLVELARQLPEVQRHLVAANVNSHHLGWSLAAIVDTLVRQLIALGEARFGKPPLPYCWLASGSLARREITVGSDQDHALLLADRYDATLHGDYFSALTEFVTEGLARCGLPRCPGGVMASNSQWRQTATQWQATFNGWIESPEPKAMMLASNFFDLRPLGGERSLFEWLHGTILEAAHHNRIFIAHLAANALHHRPPLGFFRNFLLERGGEHAHTFDLKLRGTIPIVDIARLHALAAGLPQVSTLERLQAAAEAGAMSREGAADLQHAYEFINTLRLRHQSEQLQSGEPPDNHLDPGSLSSLDRDHLKECFALIDEFQQALAQRYQTERIG